MESLCLLTVSDPCETALSPFEDRYADVSTFRTHFWRAGSAGPAVILLAGIGCSVLEWEKNIAALADRHRVYAFDMLGHGLTDKPRKNCYAIADLARFTLAFLSAQGEDSAHFIGSSLGGRIALECARLAPARVKIHGPCRTCRNRARDCARHAPCECAGPWQTPDAPQPRGDPGALDAPAFHDPSFVTNGLVETKYALARAPGAHQAVLKTLRSLVSVRGFRIEHVAALQAVMRTLQQPTLIIWGQQDRLVPADHARILEAKLPRSRTILFDECGHLPQLE